MMREIGEVVPAVVGVDAGRPAAAAGEGRVVPASMRGGEVVLPANPPALPALPRGLQGWVALAAAPQAEARPAAGAEPREVDGGIVSAPLRLPPTPASAADKEAAREPAERLRRILAARADPRTIAEWLLRIAGGVANAPTDADRRRQLVAAIVSALQVCPHLCFTSASAAEALRRWKFWPAAAEAFAFCEEVAKPYRDALRGLEAVERAPVAAGPGRERPPERNLPAERTPEEIAAVQARAAAVVADLRAREAAEAARRPIGVRPRYLGSHDLVALIEEQIRAAGGPAARPALAYRLEVERRKLGEAAEVR